MKNTKKRASSHQELQGRYWLLRHLPKLTFKKKRLKNDLEYYIAWLKGKYPQKAEALDEVFVVLENAGFLYKLVTKAKNHVRVKNVLIAGGVDGAEGLTCLLRDEIRSFWRSVDTGRVTRENKLHDGAGETQDEENIIGEDDDDVVTCSPSPPKVFGNVSLRSNSLDDVSSSDFFF